jgi:hypothetical protein
MKIVSPFKDYYDSAQAYGIDPNLIYDRTPQSHQILLQSFMTVPDLSSRLGYWSSTLAYTGLLLVCGKIYPYCLPPEYFEAAENCPATIQKNKVAVFTRTDERILNKEARPISDADYWNKLVNEYFNNFEAVIGKPISPEIHRKYSSPVILVQLPHRHWSYRGLSNEPVPAITNPRLANFGFQSILDPFTCFQEIAQYLANELAQPDIAPLRTGSDEIIARAKGFDEQSFRTAAPGNKKLNRKANRAKKKASE